MKIIMKKYVVSLAITGVILSGSPAIVRAETTAPNLEALMKQIQALQEQIKALKGEVETLRSGLKQGSSDGDVKKIQELLATDQSIYPEGLTTGFFGERTKEAVKRFQKRHGLPETGEIDEATKKLMQEYFKERQNGRFPQGLLGKEGIGDEMKKRLNKPKFEISNIRVVCKDKRKDCGVKIKSNDDDLDEDEDENDDDGIRRNRGQFASSSAITADVAENMIEDAEAAIADLKEAIADAESGSEKIRAEGKLRAVESMLRTAKNHLTAKRYVLAYNNANKAEDKALDALEDLEEELAESEDDDEDEDEDDDDDEDDEDDEDEDEDEDD